MKLHETRNVSKEEMQSTQWVRLFDVFAIAPILIVAGLMAKPKKWIKTSLIIFGIFTIFYNAFYYFKYKN